MPKKRMGKEMKIALIAPIGLAAVALFGFIVMYLWNWLAPVAFGARTVTYWQGLGLLILARILVGGLGGGHGDHQQGRRRTMDHMMDQWEQMTPEERAAFRQGLRDRCAGPEPDRPQPEAAAL